MRARHPILASLAALVLSAGAFGAGSLLALPQESASSSATFPHQVALDPALLHAHSAVVYDPLSGRILFEKNARQERPLASLTKLMAAHAVLSVRDPELRVHITPQDLAPSGESGLAAGQELSLRELLSLGLVVSSNDAIAAAAASLGDPVPIMNRSAQSLGLSARFTNPHGLDNGEDPGGIGSALDVAKLAAIFYRDYPAFFELTVGASSVGGEAGPATAQPLASIPGLLAAKTGYTARAGGNLVAVFSVDLGRPLVAVVLGSGEAERFDDIRTLIGATRLAQRPLQEPAVMP